MITYIDEEGNLHIQTQCPTEAYALGKWIKDNEIPEHGSWGNKHILIENVKNDSNSK